MAKSGFSLLEVLVACGILVIGLASVAAILPAATARLREAATHDRAASMVTAALSEFECRQLAFRGLFVTTTSPTATYLSANMAVCLGEVLREMPTTPTVLALTGTAPTLLSQRIDNSPTGSEGRRGFFLEDEVQYQIGSGQWPMNSFVGGAREFRRGVCWGAMVEPMPWGTDPNPLSANPMQAVRATIAVFQKPGRPPQLISLTGTAGGIFTTAVDEPTRKAFLGGCKPVLAVAISGATAPQWLVVNSSWMQPDGCKVVFRDEAARYQNLMVSGTLRIVGFEHILAITQKTFTVQ